MTRKAGKPELRLRPFTLMEVLVASAIIGVSLCVLLSGFSTCMRNAKAARDCASAIQLAQLKANELATAKTLKEEERSGDFGEGLPQFRWRTSVKRDASGKAWLLKAETIYGEGEDARSFSLETLRAIPGEKPEKRNASGERAPEAP